MAADLLKSLQQRVDDIEQKALSDLRNAYELDDKGQSTGKVVDKKKAAEATSRLAGDKDTTNYVVAQLTKARKEKQKALSDQFELSLQSTKGKNSSAKKQIEQENAEMRKGFEAQKAAIDKQYTAATEMITNAESFQGSLEDYGENYELIYESIVKYGTQKKKEFEARLKRLEKMISKKLCLRQVCLLLRVSRVALQDPQQRKQPKVKLLKQHLLLSLVMKRL